MHCVGKKRGKIIITNAVGAKEIIEVKQVPFTVTCSLEEIAGCGRKGQWSRSWVAARGGSCNSSDIVDGYEFEQFTFRATPASGTYDGNRYDLIRTCGSREFIEPFSFGCGSVTFASLVFTPSDESFGLKIYNQQNSLIGKFPVKNCDYKITCDDDCPDGHLKCECSAYPGYCCIPCNEIKLGIQSITAAVRSVNRG